MIGASQTTVAVAPTKLDVLYTGVDNPVSISASASTDDDLTVTISGGDGTIFKTSAGQYNIRVNTFTDNCIVNVYANRKLVGTSVFRVRSLPAPTATVGGFASGSKFANDLFKVQPGVAVFVKDHPFDVTYDIVGFTVKLLDNTNKVRDIYCEGAAFSPLAKQYIKDYVKSGDLVTIQNIRVKDQAGKEIKIPGLVYSIE